MKEWTIEEFLNECEDLCRNPYTYDYSKMPEGICNGHKVRPFTKAWHSIVIDGGVCNMAVYNEMYPKGNCAYYVGQPRRRMTALEYVRYMLEQ